MEPVTTTLGKIALQHSWARFMAFCTHGAQLRFRKPRHHDGQLVGGNASV